MKRVLFVLSLVSQLGFIIAIPAALLGFGGAYLDKTLGTSPLFILLGIGGALASSSCLVYRYIKQIERFE
ncbi:AtpZ/AtpI family protein [Candidatus Berkelbacteria bacterium]|nr:AtpZ/AtpI family protein [Candidatus Berkelbacteria bacterium]